MAPARGLADVSVARPRIVTSGRIYRLVVADAVSARTRIELNAARTQTTRTFTLRVRLSERILEWSYVNEVGVIRERYCGSVVAAACDCSRLLFVEDVRSRIMILGLAGPFSSRSSNNGQSATMTFHRYFQRSTCCKISARRATKAACSAESGCKASGSINSKHNIAARPTAFNNSIGIAIESRRLVLKGLPEERDRDLRAVRLFLFREVIARLSEYELRIQS